MNGMRGPSLPLPPGPSAGKPDRTELTWNHLLHEAGESLRVGRGSARQDPRPEAERLLRHVLGWDAATLFVKRHDPAGPPSAIHDFRHLIEMRSQGVPLQHLIGFAEFHTVKLFCEPGVLIPRPETEGLVDVALEELQRLAAHRADAAAHHQPRFVTDASNLDLAGRPRGDLPAPARSGEPPSNSAKAPTPPPQPALVLLDLCAGTGAIAVAVCAAWRASARQGPHPVSAPPIQAYAGDISPSAVALAQRNAAANDVADLVDIRLSDLDAAFPHLGGIVDVLTANPPYIDPAHAETLPVEVRFGDPPEALFDPEGGTGFHRRIAEAGRRLLCVGGLLALEIGDTQGEEARGLLVTLGYEEVRILPDLAGRDRIVRGRWATSTQSS